MKTKLFTTITSLLLGITFLFTSCSARISIEDIDKYKGASYEELSELFFGNEHFGYCRYEFIKDWRGTNVVAEFNNGNTEVVDIRAYPPVSPSHEDFEEITDGMSVFDVVERVGIPFGSFTSGVCSLDFKASDGSVYRVMWTIDIWNDMDMSVSDVSLISTAT